MSLTREELIFTSEEMARISTDAAAGNDNITVDVHGLKPREAMRFLKNVVALHYREDFVLTVIHGYNHGTAIKEMLQNTQLSCRVEDISSCAWNPGVTMFRVA